MREDVLRRRQELSNDKQALLRKRLLHQQEEASRSYLVPARQHHGPFPLSFAQQRLWFLQQLEPENAAYNEIIAARLIGPLHYTALLDAVRALVARHSILHTYFHASEGQVFQQVDPFLASQILLPLRNLQHLPISQREQAVQQQITELIGQPFHLTTELPWRALLLSVQPEEHVVLMVIHHIITDGWSMGLFVRELGLFYAATCQGMTTYPLPPPTVQYSDFVLWQYETLQGYHLSRLLAYWRTNLAGAPALLELPTDRPRPPLQTDHGQSLSVHIPASTINGLRSLAQQEDSTLFMVLLAAFALILSHYSQQEDVVVGSPVAGRTRAELEDVFGLFVNMLVLRIDLSGDPTVRQLIQRARKTALNAYTHQDLPFEKLVEELHPHRSQSHSPLFQAVLALENVPRYHEQLMDLQVSHLDIQINHAKYDLSLTLEEHDQELTGILEYNSDLWNTSTMQRFLQHWLKLLNEMVDDAQQHLSCISLLSETELFQQLVQWNPQPSLSPEITPIHTLFEQQARSIPSQTALVYEGESLTYQALNRRANRLARRLSALSIGPETLLAVSMDRSLDMVVVMLAVLKVGAAYVPLDPTYPAGRLTFILQDSSAPVLLTQQHLVSHFAFFQGVILTVDEVNEAFDSGDDANLLWSAYDDTLAYVIYTSGSTGQPKGVAVSHRNLFHAYQAYDQAYQLRSAVHLQMASFSFDVFTGDVVRSLCAGGTLILCPRETLLEPASLYSLLYSQKVTNAEFVPAVLRALLHYLQETGQTLHFMRSVVASSDTWFLHEHQLLTSLCSPSTHCINEYGVTEATIDSSYYETKQLSLLSGNITPIGHPLLGMQLYVLDKWLRPLPSMVIGELYIGGCGITRGYLNQPELTAERFLPHPFSQTPGARLYRTHDKARFLSDGTIEFLGRIDHQIKLRGFRIELGEIESVLNTLSEVQECAVIIREDRSGDSRLVAYIVPASSLATEETTLILQLRNHLKLHLPEYMLPAAFVMLSSLPLTSNGKIDRNALPSPSLTASNENFVAPSTPVEKQLAHIWCDLLGLPQVGIHEDFFDLGGHSMLVMHLISQLQRQFDRQITIATFFKCRTIAELAQQLSPQPSQEQKRSPSIPALPVVEIQRSTQTLSLFCIHPAGGTVLCYMDLARHLGKEQSCYALQSPGVDGEQEPLQSVEVMAQTYINGMRKVQPQGPYALLGWSLGGTIAFEIAQQLHQQGEKVASLVLVDSWAPTTINKAEEQNRPLLESFLQYTTQGTLHDKSFLQRVRELHLNNPFQGMLEWATQLKEMNLDLGVRQMQSLFKVFEANSHAWQQYKPRPYAGHLILLTTREQPLRRSSSRAGQMGWHELALHDVEVHTLPGNHFSILKEPHVQALAQKLKDLLGKEILMNRNGQDDITV